MRKIKHPIQSAFIHGRTIILYVFSPYDADSFFVNLPVCHAIPPSVQSAFCPEIYACGFLRTIYSYHDCGKYSQMLLTRNTVCAFPCRVLSPYRVPLPILRWVVLITRAYHLIVNKRVFPATIAVVSVHSCREYPSVQTMLALVWQRIKVFRKHAIPPSDNTLGRIPACCLTPPLQAVLPIVQFGNKTL